MQPASSASLRLVHLAEKLRDVAILADHGEPALSGDMRHVAAADLRHLTGRLGCSHFADIRLAGRLPRRSAQAPRR